MSETRTLPEPGIYAKFLPIIEEHRELLESWLPSTPEKREEAIYSDKHPNGLPLRVWDAAVGIQERETTGDIIVTNPARFSRLKDMLTAHQMTNSVANATILLKATSYYQVARADQQTVRYENVGTSKEG